MTGVLVRQPSSTLRAARHIVSFLAVIEVADAEKEKKRKGCWTRMQSRVWLIIDGRRLTRRSEGVMGDVPARRLSTLISSHQNTHTPLFRQLPYPTAKSWCCIVRKLPVVDFFWLLLLMSRRPGQTVLHKELRICHKQEDVVLTKYSNSHPDLVFPTENDTEKDLMCVLQTAYRSTG